MVVLGGGVGQFLMGEVPLYATIPSRLASATLRKDIRPEMGRKSLILSVGNPLCLALLELFSSPQNEETRSQRFAKS